MSALLFLRRLLRIQPHGRTLIRHDGRRHNRIRGDLIPVDSLVIVQDGRVFVRTDEADDSGFEIFREDHRTREYKSWND